MKKICFFSLFLIFGLVLVPVFVFSQVNGQIAVDSNKEEISDLEKEIEAKRAKVKEIEQSIEAYKKKIEQTRTETVSLKNQLSILDNRKRQVELDIEATEGKIGAAQLEIKGLKLTIEDTLSAIGNQKGLLAELIRTLYYENGKNYVQVLATNDTFSDFFSRVQQLRKVENDLGLQAKTLRQTKEELESKKNQVEDRKKLLENLGSQLTEKKSDLVEQALTKNQILVQTQSSEKTYQTLVANLKEQYRQIENEISSIEYQIRKKLEQQDKLDTIPDDSSTLSWPTQSRYITAYFHDPSYPYRNVFEHNAIDIRAAQGTPVRAAASGFVGRAKRCTVASCYAYVMIIHQEGLSTVYGHLSQIIVGDEQFVTRGDIIGYSGAMPGTPGAGPFTTGPHLHFEVRKNGIPVNPLNYLAKDY